MSSNQNTITDNFNDFDDWIEIFNTSSESIQLNDYILSDNNSSQTKWKFPTSAIQGGEHRLIWADKEIEEGEWHTNFRLQQSGESLYLFKRSSPDILELVDYIHTPSLPFDFSLGREFDGAPIWVLFENPTPNASNGEALSTDQEYAAKNLYPFPNPTTGLLQLPHVTKYGLFDISGTQVRSGYADHVDLGELSSGIYLLETSFGKFKILKY